MSCSVHIRRQILNGSPPFTFTAVFHKFIRATADVPWSFNYWVGNDAMALWSARGTRAMVVNIRTGLSVDDDVGPGVIWRSVLRNGLVGWEFNKVDVYFGDGGRGKGLESRKWVRLCGCWLRSCHSTLRQLRCEQLTAS